MRFVDEVRVSVASGRGGSGCVSFLRQKFIPKGGPDGGNGGQGGAVVFQATRQRNTLVDFRWNKVYRASDGTPGKGRQMTGAKGADLVLYVPIGTTFSDYETGECYADLSTEGATWVIAGGRGGQGNRAFRSATNRTPLNATEGQPGSEYTLRLELKLLADVGLLGFPNAGKSTLISRISAAKPKIGAYPFTTLVPNLGVVQVNPGESFVVADIPGLVPGAAQGVGLGHAFLKHVERCGVYLHLVAPDNSEGRAVDRFNQLNQELLDYDSALTRREQLVVLTKIDTLDPASRTAQQAALAKASGAQVWAISSVTGEGIASLVGATYTHLSRARKAHRTATSESL